MPTLNPKTQAAVHDVVRAVLAQDEQRLHAALEHMLCALTEALTAKSNAARR